MGIALVLAIATLAILLISLLILSGWQLKGSPEWVRRVAANRRRGLAGLAGAVSGGVYSYPFVATQFGAMVTAQTFLFSLGLATLVYFFAIVAGFIAELGYTNQKTAPEFGAHE